MKSILEGGLRALICRHGSWIAVGLVSILGPVGCNGLQKKHDNPVMIEAPRRIRVPADQGTQVADATSDSEKPGVTTVGAKFNPANPWEDWEDDTAIFNSQVAATVNGAPITNGEVLDKFSQFLIGFREKLQQERKTPELYVKQRDMLVGQLLAQHIDRLVLIESMRSTMKPEQIKMMNSHFDALFETEIEKLKRDLKVSTRTELELELNKRGTTLQNVKDGFTTDQMATAFYHHKLGKPAFIDRLDLLDYYQAHLDDYAIPKKVEWEQIQISYREATSKGKEETQERMQAALAELKAGTAFQAVAKKYSDGPTAKEGGQWEPMEIGTLADTKLEKILFDLPIGKLSPVYEGPSALHVVRVRSRTEAGRVPLGDVQDEIRKKLEMDQVKERSKDLLKSLREEAIIETRFDNMQEAAQLQSDPALQ